LATSDSKAVNIFDDAVPREHSNVPESGLGRGGIFALAPLVPQFRLAARAGILLSEMPGHGEYCEILLATFEHWLDGQRGLVRMPVPRILGIVQARPEDAC